MKLTIPLRAIPKARMTFRSKWYPRARATLAFQRTLADYFRLHRVPAFSGPVRLTCRFYFRDRRHGDLKNLIAAIEDALQYAGVIPNDRLILRYGGGTGIYYDAEERIELQIEALTPKDIGPYNSHEGRR